MHICRNPALIALLLLAASGHTMAAVSEEEAARLKDDLTPLGGIRAGNEEGTIPAWEGGYTEVAVDYKSGDEREDLFPDDKPLFRITAENFGEHEDRLTEGLKALLRKYPDSFFIDVYPTRRTAAAPQWVYDNTYKNAISGEAINGGYEVDGAYGGLPFPIPKSGAEVMWNHLLRWRGQAGHVRSLTMISDESGRVSLASATRIRFNHPFYFKDGSLDEFKEKWNSNYFYAQLRTSAPPTRQGFAFILVDNIKNGRQAWQYLVGQRRVRRAPDFGYDTPNPVTSSVDFFDEVYIQLGPFDKHNLKLVGKKEMYIPYNNNGALARPVEDLVGPHFWNPEHVRFELHRVWVVEAELRDGERHVVPRKTFYFDEDTGNGVSAEGYDRNGELWHVSLGAQTVMPEFPGVFLENYFNTDLVKGSMSSFTWNDQLPHYEKVAPYSERLMTPEFLAAEALR